MPSTRSTTVVLAAAALASLAAGAAAQGPLFLSVSDNINNGLPGLSPFTDDDAVRTTLDGSVASIEFSLAGGDLDAMHRLPNGNWLVSSLFNGSYGGVTFDDGDLVEIDPSTGTFVGTVLSNTAFDNPGADITGISILPSGNWLLSTLADNSLGGVSFTDGDIVEYNPTTGAASIFLSESDLFDDGDGDVYGIHAFDDGTLLLTTNTAEVISGIPVRDGDAFIYDPMLDAVTLYFSEDTFVGTNSWNIDALYVIPSPGAAALLALAGLGTIRRRRA